ncbi:MAG: SGNH/GDSL hydrolase family protein [SAR202 cluster bacterium]|nr:SGNH/GDSL hydrolase family protein [SAR202 cluster bacterium]
MTPAGSLRILALGDSYTIGEGVDPSQRWPVQLASRLRDSGLPMADPQIIARTGWTTDELSTAMDTANLQPPYDLVTLLIGVNNQYRNRNPHEYRGQFLALLERAVTLAGNNAPKVLVLSIPDYGVTPFAASRDKTLIAREIDQFNAINRDETLRLGARYVDITPISRTAAQDASLIASDGLHPSGKQYALWTDLALPEVLAAFDGS